MTVIKIGLSYHCLWFVDFGCYGVFRHGFPKNFPNLLFHDPQVLYFLFLPPFPTQQSLRVMWDYFSLRVSKWRVCLYIVKVVFLNLFMEGDGETSTRRKGKFKSCRRRKKERFSWTKNVGNSKGNRIGWQT